jgi:hypothetical protein
MPMVIKGALVAGSSAAVHWGVNRMAHKPIAQTATASTRLCAIGTLLLLGSLRRFGYFANDFA